MMRDKKIRVGISGYSLSSIENKEGIKKGLPKQALSIFSYDFVQSIEQSGGIPILLPIVNPNTIKDQLADLDAIIFAGGEDIHPKYYLDYKNDYPPASDARDQYEFNLIKEALLKEIPILFVCRGMQLLNVYKGGSLYIDLHDSTSTPINHWVVDDREKPVHEVEIVMNDFTKKIFSHHQLKVNSVHHQAIEQLGEGLEVIGKSKDGIIETIAVKGRNDILAVQWHPEMMKEEKSSGIGLFKWLINEAKQNLYKRGQEYEKSFR
ncbi:gamma-glutamyl-gamma-aminobutyrate hydrolase [Siminovitchia terrae]|nr:gamma-glutamyl-gamma-aminobutyrate hydrolase [Siminovitchia terrae]